MKEKTCTKCKKEFPATLEYFGKESKTGDGLRSRCKECTKADKAESYKKNIAHRKQYLAENREHILQYKKQYRDEHKEEISTYNKEYLPKYYQEHKEEMDFKNKVYRVLNRQISRKLRRESQARRRQRIKNVTVNYSYEEWLYCLEYFENRDAYTGEYMQKTSMDHVVPLSKGGNHIASNLIPCEVSVNSSKYNSDMEEWYRNQSFFSEERLSKINEYIKLMNRKDMV